MIWIDRDREETQIGREKDPTRQREEEREGGRESARASERASERAKTGGQSRQKTQWAMAGPVGP